MENDDINIVISIAQLVFVVIGGVWAYFRVWKEGIHRARIQFEIECQAFEIHHDEIPVEFRIIIKNKGLTKHKLSSINLRVRGIKEKERLELWEGNEPRLLFPHKLIDTEVIYRKKYTYVFVEPGVEQMLNYIIKLPATQKLIAARAEFQYDETKNHSIEKIFELKTTNNAI